MNEGNVLKEFSYIFSTGPNLDSMELTGSVKLAETGGVDSTLIVMLHRSGEDSALVNENPRYVTRLDNKGFFHFRFLAPGTYYIYAIKDESSTRRYYSPTQLFAFADSSIEVGSELSPVTLYAFAEPAAQTGGSQLISFGGGRGPSRGEDRRLRVTNNLNNNIQDLLNDFSLSFEQPLMNIDTNKLRLSTDSSFNPVTGYSWTIDSTNKKITLNTKWRENTLYNLVMDIDFAEDSSGKKLLKTDTLHFTTRRLEEYGSVKITFHNLDTLQNHVLLVLQSNRVVKAIPFQQDVIYQPMVNPGEYDLRILYDRNGNNRWDPGEFFGKHVQPEIVKPIDRKVSVKANFENDIEINL